MLYYPNAASKLYYIKKQAIRNKQKLFIIIIEKLTVFINLGRPRAAIFYMAAECKIICKKICCVLR